MTETLALLNTFYFLFKLVVLAFTLITAWVLGYDCRVREEERMRIERSQRRARKDGR